MPARKDLNLRKIGAFLRNMALVRVIGGGEDFEYRIVGDAHVTAFRIHLQNRTLCEIEREAPVAAEGFRTLYQKVVATRSPLALRIHVIAQPVHTTFRCAEAVLLPFGDSNGGVDHVATFSCYQNSDGVSHPAISDG